MNLLDLIQRFNIGPKAIKEWLGEGGETVNPSLAQKRADVCLVCPQNIKSGFVNAQIADAIRRQVGIKNTLNLRVRGEKKLGKCSACECENRLKIWLPIRNVLPDKEEHVNFDVNCWLLNEPEN